MLLSYRQRASRRSVLRVGWLTYRRLWLEERSAEAREWLATRGGARLLPATRRGIAGLAGGVAAVGHLVATVLGPVGRMLRRVLGRVRPRPFRDGALVALLAVLAIAGLGVAVALSFALSAWAATDAHDVLIAAVGAIVVGTLVLVLLVLVFASSPASAHEARRARARRRTARPAVARSPAPWARPEDAEADYAWRDAA